MISPAEFIPVAEDIGLIASLGEWVLREACNEAVKWPTDVKVAVNLSPVQFRSRNLVQVVISAGGRGGDHRPVRLAARRRLQRGAGLSVQRRTPRSRGRAIAGSLRRPGIAGGVSAKIA
jgi:hypothetical protein